MGLSSGFVAIIKIEVVMAKKMMMKGKAGKKAMPKKKMMKGKKTMKK